MENQFSWMAANRDERDKQTIHNAIAKYGDHIAVLTNYREDQWEALHATAVDELHPTWREWKEEGEKIMAELKARGIPYVCVLLDVEEIQQYCKEQGIPNDAEARQRLSMHKYEAEHKGH